MKPSEIPNYLAQINFVLAKNPKDIKAFYEHEGRREFFNPYHYPETEKHNDDCVKYLIDIVKYNKPYKVVIHTFNDVFISTIGAWISMGKLPADCAKIFIIEGDEVKISTYTNEGTLKNWHFGWFLQDIEVIRNADLS